MNNLILVFLGGGLGSVTRYGTGMFLGRFAHFRLPWGTLTVNLVASFILGLMAGLILLKPGQYEQQRLLIGVGFCGGLSTFSTFTLEVFDFVKSGDYMMAGVYTVLSVAVCLLAFAAAQFILKGI